MVEDNGCMEPIQMPVPHLQISNPTINRSSMDVCHCNDSDINLHLLSKCLENANMLWVFNCQELGHEVDTQAMQHCNVRGRMIEPCLANVLFCKQEKS